MHVSFDNGGGQLAGADRRSTGLGGCSGKGVELLPGLHRQLDRPAHPIRWRLALCMLAVCSDCGCQLLQAEWPVRVGHRQRHDPAGVQGGAEDSLRIAGLFDHALSLTEPK
jgi:hypothetical protein